MHSLKSIQDRIEKGIAGLSFPDNPAELYEPIRYLLSLGGKRLRPSFVLLGCDLFGGDIEKAISPAMGIELFHNFTLMHDDIMDKAPLRRSQPTVHARWNENIAILSGDALFVKSCQLMMQTNAQVLPEVLDLFFETALRVCEGQQYDMNFETQQHVVISEYLEMIALKTSELLAASLQIGAIIAGADKEEAKKIYRFGKNAGMAFQLQDDLLDVYGGDSFGKLSGGDIVANKKTYLFLKAFDLADTNQRNKLTAWYLSKPTDTTEKVKSVRQIFDEVHVKEAAQHEMELFYRKGVEYLDSIKAEEANKKVLRNLVNDLLVRNT